MVSEIEFGGLVFVVNLPARWAHYILVLTMLPTMQVAMAIGKPLRLHI